MVTRLAGLVWVSGEHKNHLQPILGGKLGAKLLVGPILRRVERREGVFVLNQLHEVQLLEGA